MKLKALFIPEARVSRVVDAVALVAVVAIIIDSAWNDVYDSMPVPQRMWANPVSLLGALIPVSRNLVDSHSLLLALIGIIALIILNLVQAGLTSLSRKISFRYMQSTSPLFDDYEFWHVTGVALGAQTWSSTHVSGGQVTSNGGVISSTPVSSHSVTHNRFFLRLQDGREQEVELTDSFGVRDGHMITIIYGKLKGKQNQSGSRMYCYNHGTGREHVWRAARKASGLASSFDGLIAFIVCCLISWIAYYFVEFWCFLVGPLSGIALYVMVLRPPLKRRHDLLLNKFRDEMRPALALSQSYAMPFKKLYR
jgi:hypothetical protein